MDLSDNHEEIDRLLELYLSLTHQYDVLRGNLNKLYSSVQYNIARANYKAARGVRYGEELYDARMQASRLCNINLNGENCTAATIVTFSVAQAVQPYSQDGEKSVGIPDQTAKCDSRNATSKEDCSGDCTRVNYSIKNPIRMFGILVPQELRLAQEASIKLVQDVIPKILTVDAEMKELEIKIRRVRKHRDKAHVKDCRNITGSEGTRN